MKRLNIFIVSLVLLSTAACGNALLVTGETLKATGKQFRAVAGAYFDGCDPAKRTMPVEDCNNFTRFGQDFERGFPLAVELWTLAKESRDKSLTAKVEEVVVDLAGKLSVFAVKILNAVTGAK